MCYWNNKLFNNLLSVLLKVWEDPPPQGHHLSQVPRTILSLGKEKLKMDHLRWVLHHRGQWHDISAHNNVPSLFPNYRFYIWLMCYLFSFVADIKKSLLIVFLQSLMNANWFIFFMVSLHCLVLLWSYLNCLFRLPVSQPYTPAAVNLSGPQPPYGQQFGAPPVSMQQMTNQMASMQVGSTAPSPAGPGYGK